MSIIAIFISVGEIEAVFKGKLFEVFVRLIIIEAVFGFFKFFVIALNFLRVLLFTVVFNRNFNQLIHQHYGEYYYQQYYVYRDGGD